MRRREFIALLGAAPIVLALATRAQQSAPMRRVVVLDNLATDAQRTRIDEFSQALKKAGWVVGRNLRLDYRSAAGNVDDPSQIRSGIRRALS